MKQNRYSAALPRLTAIGLVLVTGVFSHFAAAQDAPLTDGAIKNIEEQKRDYSPCPDQHFPNRVLWGDTIPASRLTTA